MRVTTNIQTDVPYSPDAGVARLQAAAPRLYGTPSVQQHYADVYAPMAQKAAMDLSRGATRSAGDFTNRANAAQNQAVLAGLSQLSKQRANAQQREAAMQEMAYGWMNNMAKNSPLGGLL